MDPQASAKPYIKRFGAYGRISHFLLMCSFLGLAGTGLPLLYSHTKWAWWLSRIWGGYATAGVLHRFCAVILLSVFVFHLGWVVYRVVFKRELGLLWGPGSMVPQPRDFQELWAHMRWFLGKGPRPIFDRFTYWEKFDYLAVFWGVAIIGASGIVMWAAQSVTHVLPGWAINIALIIHSDEALLAAGFIFAFHFFNVHFRPEKFPMDPVIFSGRISKTELLHSRKRWWDRMVAEGRLDEWRVKDEWERWKKMAHPFGYLMFSTGVALLVLIVFAMSVRLGH